MASSPTQRTLAECRRRGWRAQVVERWIPQAKRRIDLFGCIDVVALDGEPGVLGIQAVSDSGGAGVAGHMRKVTEDCADAVRDWLEAGNRLVLWGWAKRGPAGKRKLWRVREVEVTLDMLEEVA